MSSEGVWCLSTSATDKGTTRPDLRVARLAAQQHTIVSARQVAAYGIGGDAIAVRVRRGHLHRIFRGVYSVVSRESLSLHGLFTAAVMACGRGAVLSHFAAAVYWGMLRSDDRAPEVTVPRNGGRKIAGIRVHRSRKLDPRDVWRRGALLVTSPERTALDLAAVMEPRALRRMIRQAQAERRLDIRRLVDVIERSPGHHGIPALRGVIAEGYTPTRSELEDRFLDLLDGAGIERPALNHKRVVRGRVVICDLRWPELRLVVELDGAAWHDNRLTREDDARKQALLEADGDRVLRITWAHVVRHPQQTVARLSAALEQARRAYAPSSSA